MQTSMNPRRILTHIDLTGDEPVFTYAEEPYRPPLADITGKKVGRRRGRRLEEAQMSVYGNEENSEPVRVNRQRGRQAAMQQQGAGLKGPNAWIRHVKDFALRNNIAYWEALKSPKCKMSYRKSSGGDILDDIKNVGKAVGSAFQVGGVNPFTAGYDLGHDVIGPAIFGGKGLKKQGNSWIQYVKAFLAEKNHMNYRDALKDPRCKASYKKGSGLAGVLGSDATGLFDKYGDVVDSIRNGNIKDVANTVGNAVNSTGRYFNSGF